MDNQSDVLYNYTAMSTVPVSETNSAFIHMLQQSLSWEYLGGGHDCKVCHQATDWRLLPFLVIVCPVENDYFSEIENIGTIRIAPGEALLVPGGIRHTVAMPEAGILHYAHIRFGMFGSLDVTGFYDIPYRVTGSVAWEISGATAELSRAMELHPANIGTITRAIVRQELSSRLLRLITSAASLKEEPDRISDIFNLRPIFTYLEESLALPISRSDLARIMSLSETRFHYVFTDVMGVSPMAYVRNLRLKEAQMLLARTQMSVSEIGENVGYPDICHFSKVFKKAFGVSPLGYRRSLQQWLLSTSKTISGRNV